MSDSTAIGTIATADYVGRFAPSPTGPLHLGSLVSAAAAFLEARRHGGRWLVRIEDLDVPRCLPGMAHRHLAVLEALGFEWDGPVLYQSTRRDAYAAALTRLERAGRVYRCTCSRRALEDAGAQARYPGTCRHQPAAASGAAALRLSLDALGVESLGDRWQGPQRWSLESLGDPVIRRRDGHFAYQLAVVVDDAAQAITDIVRGADLLASCPWQLALQRLLDLPRPAYAHVPLVVEPGGAKLSKSERATPLDRAAAPRWLVHSLNIMRQAPPPELARASVAEIWRWAHAHWQPERLRGLATVPAPLAADLAVN